MMTKWDKFFMDIALRASFQSKDPSTKVGASICNDKNRFVSCGYNGFPAGVSDTPEVYANRERKYLRTIHAEVNAILFAQRDLTDCTIYVTHHPCAQCAALIAQVGICRVMYISTDDLLGRWDEHLEEAKQIFYEASILSVGVQYNSDFLALSAKPAATNDGAA